MDLLNALLDQSGQLVVVLDCETARVADCNEAQCRASGRSREELVGQPVGEVHVNFPLGAGEHWDYFLGRIRAEPGLTVETRFRRANGSLYPVRVECSIREWAGRSYVLVTGREVSGSPVLQSHFEREARWQKALYQMASHPAVAAGRFAEAAAFIAVTGQSVFPASHCRIWRLEGEEVKFVVDDLGPPRPGLERPVELSDFPWLRSALLEGRCTDLYESCRTVDEIEETRSLAAVYGCKAVLSCPIRAGGTIWGVLTVGSDSERKWQPDEIGFAAEIADQVANAVSTTELRSSQERYRSFVEMSAEAVWRVEFTEPVSLALSASEQIAAYFARGYVAECNDACLRFFGRERREELIGMPLSQLLGSIDERHLCEMRQIVEAGYRVVDLEVRHIVDGRERWALRNATGFFENGCLVQFWGASRDITERKRVEEELRALSARRASTLEQERTRIAREIHDELGQQLTALKFEAAAWESGARTPAKGDLTRSIDAAIQSVRRIATELRPAILDHFGLVAAMEWMANDFSRRTGIECDCELDTALEVDTALATTVFRIFQEALTNATRHSEAKLVQVRLASREGRLELSVEDNGKGFSPGEPSSSLGLIGMRERAKEAGGAVAISGVPGRGTRVVAWFPLAPVETPA